MKKGLLKNGVFYAIVFLGIIGIVTWATGGSSGEQTTEIPASEFVTQLEENQIKKFTIQPNAGVYKITGEYRKAQPLKKESDSNINIFGSTETSSKSFTTSVLQNDSTVSKIDSLAKGNNIEVAPLPEESSGIWVTLLVSVLPLVIFVFFIYMMNIS